MSAQSILDLAAEHTAKVHEAQRDAEKPVFGTGNFKKKVVSESMGVHPDQIDAKYDRFWWNGYSPSL